MQEKNQMKMELNAFALFKDVKTVMKIILVINVYKDKKQIQTEKTVILAKLTDVISVLLIMTVKNVKVS